MKEILNGLAIIAALVISIHIIMFVLGVIVILGHNLLGTFINTNYIEYNWVNIRHNGGGAMIAIICICAFLFIAYLFGTAIKL